MQCMHYVPSLSITMGIYTLTDHFVVVGIPDTNVILGVQWLITLGKVTTYWETLQMEWVDRKSGKNNMIKGMHTYPHIKLPHRNKDGFAQWKQGPNNPIYYAREFGP